MLRYQLNQPDIHKIEKYQKYSHLKAIENIFMLFIARIYCYMDVVDIVVLHIKGNDKEFNIYHGITRAFKTNL